jgi:hypothetical protein
MSSCTICGGNSRAAIDLALAGGQSVRQVAAQFGSSKSAIARHRQKCKPAPVGAIALVPAQSAANEEIAQEIHKLRLAQRAAKRKHDTTGMLAISRELRAWLGLQAKSEITVLGRPAAEQPVTRAEAIQMSKVLIEAELKASNPEIVEWLREIAAWLPVEASCEETEKL